MKLKEKAPDKLFLKFPSVNTNEWKNLIERDLNITDYEKKLVWNTNEGFKVKPFYRNENLKTLTHLDMFPGEYPFVRSNKINNNHWVIRQDIIVENIKEANKKAIFLTENGIESLGFIFFKIPSTKDFHILLDNINTTTVEINLLCNSLFYEILENFITYLKEKKANLNKINGSINYQPLSQSIIQGNIKNISEFKILFHLAKILPKFKILNISGDLFHNSGSSITQELGFAFSQAAEYLDQLTEKGFRIDEIVTRMKFHFAIGSNYFFEIAKLRTARLLWSKMVEAYKPKDKKAFQIYIHSTSSSWNKTIYDPYVNMLRTTTEAMSAIIGGTDSLIIEAFDKSYQISSEFGDRIARNQQLILKEESFLDKVIDPAAGSYYIETLTDLIAEQTWKIFIETEEKGGFLNALKSGFIQNTIKKTAQKRDFDIATRKEILLGTNQYPNISEKIEINLNKTVFNISDSKKKKTTFEPLKLYRGAQAFEILRYKTDLFAQKNKRPLVFLLTYGNLSIRRTRAIFASNFFACAGFDIQDNNGFSSLDKGIEVAKKVDANIVVMCSSDEEYFELLSVHKKIVNDTIIVVAGYPKAIVNKLKIKGIEHFIHLNSNVLDMLKKFQFFIGVK